MVNGSPQESRRGASATTHVFRSVTLMLIDKLAAKFEPRTDEVAGPSPRSAARHPQTDDDVIALLERRFGRAYTRQRLGIERDHEARMSAGGIRSLRSDNWYTAPWLIRTALRGT